MGKITDNDIIPLLTDQPHFFAIDGEVYTIYPPSLGITYKGAAIMSLMDINEKVMRTNAAVETLRQVMKHRDLCAQLVSVYCAQGKAEANDALTIGKRAETISKGTTDAELAKLVMLVLGSGRSVNVYKDALGITKDNDEMRKVQAAKKNENSYSFGGKSIYGALIGAACKEYGWTYDEVVWGISYANLQLMLADTVTSIYLSKDEQALAHIPSANARHFDGNTPEGIAAFRKATGL